MCVVSLCSYVAAAAVSLALFTGCPPNPAPPPTPPDASDAAPSEAAGPDATPPPATPCSAACAALASAGCAVGKQPDCTTVLARIDGARLIREPAGPHPGQALTCADASQVKTAADATALGLACP